MNVYNAKRLIKEIESELQYLYELKEIAFESTQPKASKIKDIMVQGGHMSDKYVILDYSIDEIEPRIKKLEEILKITKDYVSRYKKILEEYDPLTRKIIMLREEEKLKWREIEEACHYSEKSCRNRYDDYKNKDI